jgi:hypothetical protein
VAGAVHNGDVVLVSLELSVSYVNGNTSLPLLLEPVHDPCELEGCFTFLLSLFSHFLDDVLGHLSCFVEQPSNQSALSVVHMPYEGNINVLLFLSHTYLLLSGFSFNPLGGYINLSPAKNG